MGCILLWIAILLGPVYVNLLWCGLDIILAGLDSQRVVMYGLVQGMLTNFDEDSKIPLYGPDGVRFRLVCIRSGPHVFS